MSAPLSSELRAKYQARHTPYPQSVANPCPATSLATMPACSDVDKLCFNDRLPPPFPVCYESGASTGSVHAHQEG